MLARLHGRSRAVCLLSRKDFGNPSQYGATHFLIDEIANKRCNEGDDNDNDNDTIKDWSFHGIYNIGG
jgi:hypothetical protein